MLATRPDQLYCVLDYETRSKADLKKVGAYEYANHPSTRILCVGWRVGTFEELKLVALGKAPPPTLWSPALSPDIHRDLFVALSDPSIILVAHNAFFEQMITRFVLSKFIPNPYIKMISIERWVCTASMARALALPGKLEEACKALSLPIQKDKEGHRLMLKMSKPRKPSKKNPAVWHNKLSDLKRLMSYCGTDVDAEAALFTSIPKLSPSERRLWVLDQEINLRGFRADRPLVLKTLEMIEKELERFKQETLELTDGRLNSTKQVALTLDFLGEHGCSLPNLQKKTIEDALEAGLASGKALELLRIRQDASKTSISKYAAFEMRSRTDGRVRDNLVYHTASTGRWGGAGVQPQNFPARGIIADTDHAADFLLSPDVDLELIRLLWGNPLSAFSSLLRSVIQASEGKELFGGDFAGIEVRVLFWVALHEAGLKAFREGRDLYRELATVIYGKKLADVLKPEREVGKRGILGCGFGMGAKRFFDTCKLFGQEVTMELAERAVKAYREMHAPIPRLWYNLENAAISAVRNPGKKFTINRTSWWVEKKFLYCELPSGRRLAYYGPEIRLKETNWGEMKPTLHHWGVHPQSKKWVFESTYGGKLTENVVQGIARDLMAGAMLDIDKEGYEILITVHDEILTEREKGKGNEKEFEQIMSRGRDWAKGLPINVETWTGLRYKK